MIDLHLDDVTLSRHVMQHYDHLSPPMNPGMRQRMQWTAEDAAPRDGASADATQAWLDTPSYALPVPAALDRARGAMLGLAIGDAIGTTLEFTQRDAACVRDMVGGGPFSLQPGEWTDDTSMALCLADALIAEGAWVPAVFADLLRRWYRFGHNSMNGRCFDIGHTTRSAIEGWAAMGAAWQGNTDPGTAGNGSLVRLAPMAIACRGSLRTIWRWSRSQSAVTHAAMEAIHGCQVLGMILCHALQGADREHALAPKIAPLPVRLQIINAGEYKSKLRTQIRSSGYVVDTLEAALWAVWHSRSFEDAVLQAANLGDDADSVAAVAGQIAGAIYGLSGIPPDWVQRLAWSEDIMRRADALFAMNLDSDRAPSRSG